MTTKAFWQAIVLAYVGRGWQAVDAANMADVLVNRLPK